MARWALVLWLSPTLPPKAQLQRIVSHCKWGPFNVKISDLLRVRAREIAATANLETVASAGAAVRIIRGSPAGIDVCTMVRRVDCSGTSPRRPWSTLPFAQRCTKFHSTRVQV
jgi:hypothetical protein